MDLTLPKQEMGSALSLVPFFRTAIPALTRCQRRG